MKHFVNQKDTVVTEAIDGLLRTSGGALTRLDTFPDIKVIIRSDWTKEQVALISGGGAGHEPSHAGFVGQGMLTAAVSGEIFASPSVEAVLTAIRAVTGDAGCLLIVKNYTGDRLNFGLAAERARAEGYNVEMVIVADDIALPEIIQPRGVAGTLFIHKIIGHMAENGAELTTIHREATALSKSMMSLGVSLSSCAIPGQVFEERLGPNEGELGLGIHGEAGVERIAVQEIRNIVDIMAERLLKTMNPAGRYALLINNLGAVTPLEMGVIANEIMTSTLRDRIDLVIGPAPLMTALNMNGFSISVCETNEERDAALQSDVAPSAWPSAQKPADPMIVDGPPSPEIAVEAQTSQNDDLAALIANVCDRLITLETELNRLDAKTGDGDTGSTVATGAKAVLAKLDRMPLAEPGATMNVIGDTLASAMGGSSGVLLSIFFTATGKALSENTDAAAALSAGLERIGFYGGAAPGDRTMVDALAPALSALASEGLAAASAAARKGAESTATMTSARAGRSTYLSARDLDGVIDPGALAVAEAFEAANSSGP